MLANVVTCVDLAVNPASVAGFPCSSGQGAFVIQSELYSPGAVYDGAMASEFFFFGFGVIVFSFLLGFAVSQIRKPIRQA